MSALVKLTELLNHPEADQRLQGAELAVSLGVEDALADSLEWLDGVPLLPNPAWLPLLLASSRTGAIRGLPWLPMDQDTLTTVLALPNLDELNLLDAGAEHVQRLVDRPWRRLGLRCGWNDEHAVKPLDRLRDIQELDLTGHHLPNLRRAKPTSLRISGRNDGKLPRSLRRLTYYTRDLVPKHLAGLELDVLEVAQAGYWSSLPKCRLLRTSGGDDTIVDALAEEVHVLHAFSGDAAKLPRMTWVSVREGVPASDALKVVDLAYPTRGSHPPGTHPSPLGVAYLDALPGGAWPDWVRSISPWRVRVEQPGPWRKIAAIKAYRSLTGFGLLAAKRHCDPLMGHGTLGLDRRRAEELADAIRQSGAHPIVDRW